MAQINALVTANLPSLVNISYALFISANPDDTGITESAVQTLALKLIQEETAGITDLIQLSDLELSAIDQAFATLDQ